VDNLLGALLRGIERDALMAARQPVIYDHRGREVYFAKAESPMFRGEIATSVDDIYGLHWAYGSTRYNPDMLAIKKGGLKVYHEMRLDDQAKAALHLKKSAIVHPGWTVEGENEQLVEFVEHVFNGMVGTVEDLVRSILSAYDYGFSVHEKVYAYIEDGPFKGKIGVSSIKQKSPTRILFRTDDFGNLLPDGIVQQQRDGQLKGMPPDKFVLFSYGKEFDNFYGESDLRAAYRFWFLKVNFFRYWGMYLEKFGMPLVLGKAPNAGLGAADQAAFRALVANLQAGMSATLPKDLEVEFVEAARTDRGTFEQAINACDIRIARAVLMPTLLGLSAGQDKGSLARSQTEADTFDMVLGGDSRSVQDALNEQLVRPLVDINFGKQQEYPRFCFKPMREEDKKAFVSAWADAVSKQAARSTIETDKHVRSLLSFPEMTPEEEKEAREAKKAAQELAKAAQNAPTGKGEKDEKDDKGPAAGEKPKTYVLTTLNAQEARKAWKDHVDQLDGLEEDSKSALSEAFYGAIQAMAIDSKKNS
jgi:hypothetical protein